MSVSAAAWRPCVCRAALLRSLSVCLLCCTLLASGDDDGKVTLTFGAVFPMEASAGGWAGGPACLPAVQMALEDVNSRTDILPGYRLQCQPGLAVQQMYNLLYTPPTKIMLISGCSTVTTVISQAAPVWKLVVVVVTPHMDFRYLTVDSSLGHDAESNQVPSLFELLASEFDYLKNFIGRKSAYYHQWRKCSFIGLAKFKFCQGIKVQRQSFYGDPADAVKTLKRLDARIIVGLFYEADARRVLCQAYKQGVFGIKYVWFFIGWYADTWYTPQPEEHLNCTAEQMKEAAQYHFTTESLMLSLDVTPGISGMNGQQFIKRLVKHLNTNPAETGGFPEAPLAYDAVWALALAVKCTINALPPGVRIEDFSYENKAMADQIFDCVKNTSFQGVSGKVMFSDSGDRIVQTQIEQMQDGKYVKMGYYDMNTKNLTWFHKERWFRKAPPPDSTIVRKQIVAVSIEIYYGVCFFSVLGLFMTIGLFIFNRKYGYRSVIAQSQPQCNEMLLLGCALCCSALFIMGLPAEGLTLSSGVFDTFCHIRIYLLMVGFTFAYGSMFAKVWIVHRLGATESQQLANRHKDEEEATPWDSIRTLITSLAGKQGLAAGAAGGLRKTSSTQLNATKRSSSSHSSLAGILNQPISPGKFYLVIATFLLADAVIILTWIFIDPLKRKELIFPTQAPPDNSAEEDTVIQPILEQCRSGHQDVWIGVILGFKCILLVFGLFLAYESRKLKLRYINDARFVGLAIYNVGILALVTGPVVTLLIQTQTDANFAFVAVTVLLCTYISMGLIFVPKIRHVYRIPPTADESEPRISNGTQKMSNSDKSKLEAMLKENDILQQKLNNLDEKMKMCRRRIDLLTNGAEAASYSEMNTRGTTGLSISEEHTFSSPTTLTTTAQIELQPSGTSNNNRHDFTGHLVSEEVDNSDSSSDEIFL